MAIVLNDLQTRIYLILLDKPRARDNDWYLFEQLGERSYMPATIIRYRRFLQRKSKLGFLDKRIIGTRDAERMEAKLSYAKNFKNG